MSTYAGDTIHFLLKKKLSVIKSMRFSHINPLSPHEALKHLFTSPKTESIFLQQRVLERKFPSYWFTNTWLFSLIFKQHQVIFTHYKSRIATAIRGL